MSEWFRRQPGHRRLPRYAVASHMARYCQVDEGCTAWCDQCHKAQLPGDVLPGSWLQTISEVLIRLILRNNSFAACSTWENVGRKEAIYKDGNQLAKQRRVNALAPSIKILVIREGASVLPVRHAWEGEQERRCRWDHPGGS